MKSAPRRAAVGPFDYFDGIFCLNLDSQPERWRAARSRHRALGIARRVERFAAVPILENHHQGCALSWRAMIEAAERRGYERVLVLEDEALFLDATLPVLSRAFAEIVGHEWDLLFLGAAVWGQQFPPLPGCVVLRECGPVTTTHAPAVHRRAYERILADVPAGGASFEARRDEWIAIDQYFSRQIDAGVFRAFITNPRVATQAALLNYANADSALAERYVI